MDLESPFRPRGPLDEADAIAQLTDGEIDVIGLMPWSSNRTFLVDVHGDQIIQAVYKPARGERPLWDFPPGLYRREVATYELSHQLGWDLVPPTVRREGPLGEGSLQLFVTADFEQHYFTILEEPAHHPALQRLCILDIIANSTDRKGGHCLLDADGHVWAIDNGLTFHHDFKLRTVIWDWADEPIPTDILDDVAALLDAGLADGLGQQLDPVEREAALTRARTIVQSGSFPVDPSGRRYPWPLV